MKLGSARTNVGLDMEWCYRKRLFVQTANGPNLHQVTMLSNDSVGEGMSPLPWTWNSTRKALRTTLLMSQDSVQHGRASWVKAPARRWRLICSIPSTTWGQNLVDIANITREASHNSGSASERGKEDAVPTSMDGDQDQVFHEPCHGPVGARERKAMHDSIAKILEKLQTDCGDIVSTWTSSSSHSWTLSLTTHSTTEHWSFSCPAALRSVPCHAALSDWPCTLPSR